MDGNGRMYYYNSLTDESTYDFPDDYEVQNLFLQQTEIRFPAQESQNFFLLVGRDWAELSGDCSNLGYLLSGPILLPLGPSLDRHPPAARWLGAVLGPEPTPLLLQSGGPALPSLGLKSSQKKANIQLILFCQARVRTRLMAQPGLWDLTGRDLAFLPAPRPPLLLSTHPTSRLMKANTTCLLVPFLLQHPPIFLLRFHHLHLQGRPIRPAARPSKNPPFPAR